MVFGKDKTLFDAFINKKSLKRHSRYFEEAGGLEVKHLTQAEDIYFWLNSFFDQHIQRWATRSDPSLFLHRDHRDFYRALLMEMGGTGRLLFTVVSSQGKPIAFHFGFIDDKKLIWYKPSFDPAFADRSPGEVLLRELAMFVRDQGLEELDFTRGGESFKTRFSNTVRRNASVVLTGSVKKAMLLQMRGQIRKSSFLRRFMECSRDAYASFLAVWTARQQVEQERQEFHKTQNAQEYYDSERIVSLYRLEGGLQKPEAAILELLRPSLSSMRMLDAGVGAGRTSLYFAPRVCSYAAFDYSPNMVRAAQELNGDYISPDAFSTGDMRHMSNRGPVDLLLISYNTIDCVSHEDRLLVLEEVKKTLSLGGWFVFSAHNIQSLTVFRGSGLGRLFKDFRRFLLLSAGHYQVPLYYISPMEQVRQLEAFGFKDVHVFSLETGKECPESSWADLKDSWLYYLCRRAENE
jgi:SAM-dependent methyltransferase